MTIMSKKLIYPLCFILVLCASHNASAELVGRWRLDGNAADSSGGGHDGEIFGEPKWVDGKIGGAMEIDGDDWIEMPGTSAAEGFAGMEGEVTWTAWFKTSNSGVINTLMAQGPAGAAHIQGNRSINIEASGVIMIRAHSVGALTSLNSTAVVNDGQWHHVAVTIAFETDGANDTMKVYIDGDLSKGYETDTVDINQYSGPAADFIVTLGARGTTPFVGLIDDVRIYDHVLSEVEVLSAMEGKPWPYAFGPNPADGALHEDTWVNLSWVPGELAVSHDIYLGDNFDEVNAGAEGTFQGNQTGTFIVVGFPGFAYPDGLVPGTTYYWRIDEVNDAEPNSPWKGDIWSFSIPPKTAYFPDPADGAESVAVDVQLGWTGGFGSKLHTVYFGDNLDDVSNAAGGLPQGSPTYTPGPLEMAKTYYWRIDEFDATDTFKGDIWSFLTEGAVGSPAPAKGSVDVAQTPVLTWVPGVFADTYEVYFGTDEASLELKGSGGPGSESFEPGQLEWNTTYYWRVDEANSANADSPWTGPLWSFTTANFLIVDDMESYNDLDESDPASNRIYLAWIDGFDNPTANGSVVGNLNAPFAEQTIVNNGIQSMPMSYDNSVGKSEATLTLTSNKDWTVNGVTTLTIWFRGASGNAAESLYVALNGGTPVPNDDPDAATRTSWTEWNIDLQSFGVNLANVNSITLGLSSVTGGTGIMYFDDIRLYPPQP